VRAQSLSYSPPSDSVHFFHHFHEPHYHAPEEGENDCTKTPPLHSTSRAWKDEDELTEDASSPSKASTNEGYEKDPVEPAESRGSSHPKYHPTSTPSPPPTPSVPQLLLQLKSSAASWEPAHEAAKPAHHEWNEEHKGIQSGQMVGTKRKKPTTPRLRTPSPSLSEDSNTSEHKGKTNKSRGFSPEYSPSPVMPLVDHSLPELSPALAARVAREKSDFLDSLGFGRWTYDLDPADPEERQLINELLSRVYNRRESGFYIHEVFGYRHGQNSSRMCDSFFRQLLLLAKHSIVAFATEKADFPGQYDVCYDSPTLYNNVPGYFTQEFRRETRMNGTGGGRKKRKGAPGDFTEGMDYFKSRTRAIAACKTRSKQLAKMKREEQERVSRFGGETRQKK